MATDDKKKVKTMKRPAAWKTFYLFSLYTSPDSVQLAASTRKWHFSFPPPHLRINRPFQQAAQLVPEADGGIPERQSDGPDHVLEERLGTVCPDWPIQAGPHVSARSVMAKGNKLGYTQTLGYDSLRVGFVGLFFVEYVCGKCHKLRYFSRSMPGGWGGGGCQQYIWRKRQPWWVQHTKKMTQPRPMTFFFF